MMTARDHFAPWMREAKTTYELTLNVDHIRVHLITEHQFSDRVGEPASELLAIHRELHLLAASPLPEPPRNP
jgi:hypothetical protein